MTRSKFVFVLLVLIVVGTLLMGTTYAAPPEQTAGRTVTFASQDWYVKAGENLGPGPNNFSDDPQSVWVDAEGKLHLKIRNIDGVWHSAEVYSMVPAKYGLHRFYVDTPMNNLDMNVVLGLFIYQDGINEIDIEVAKWSQPDAPNAQFTIQPYDVEGNMERFKLGWDGQAIFEFDWQPNAVNFKVMPGHNPDAGAVIHEWTYTNGIIPDEDPAMLLRMNLWIVNPPGVPANGQEIEVVIADLEAPPSMMTSGGVAENCDDLRLTDAITMLLEAQSAIDTENYSEALAKVTPARAELQRIEACLAGGNVTSPVVAAVPTPIPEPTVTPIPVVPSNPTVTITNATANQVQGIVQPAVYCTSNYKLAVFAATDHWYVQPFADARRDVQINADCSWVANTHPWDRLAVHLVSANYNIPTEVLGQVCPPLTENILASDCWIP